MAARPATEFEPWSAAWGAMLGASGLRQLRLGCSYIPRIQPGNWFSVVEDPRRMTLTEFELNHGLEQARTEHNLECLATARRTRRMHIGRRAGFVDLFLPVVNRNIVQGVLVCGPILSHEPTLDSLEEAWKEISGARVDPDDERFLSFVRAVLDSYVFAGRSFQMLVRHVRGLAAVMAGTANPPLRRHMSVWLALRKRVPEVGMWQLSSELVDARTNARWIASYRGTDRALAGIPRMPNYVIALAPTWRDAAKLSAAELLLRTHLFQRTCAVVASELDNTIAGQVGAEAAFFLTHIQTGRRRRERAELELMGERLRRLIRRKFDADIVCGFSSLAVHGGELPARYDEALWAVSWALHRNQPSMFHADARPEERSPSAGLYRSSRVLCEAFARGGRRETALAAERAVKDVLWTSGGSLEVMRSHFLQILWELLALVEQRDIVEKSTFSELETRFTEVLKKARTTHEVTNSFIELVRDLESAQERPAKINRRAKLARARKLIELALLDGQREAKLDRKHVALRVGMSQSNFTRAFKATYGTTFGAFVLRSRIERSKQLLRDTGLRVTEVSRAAGWGSASYFHQAFRRVVGLTPEKYKASLKVRRRL